MRFVGKIYVHFFNRRCPQRRRRRFLDSLLGTLANHDGDGNKDMEKQKI